MSLTRLSARLSAGFSAGSSAHYSRILMASLMLAGLAMIAAVWWYYLRQRAAVEENAVHRLTAIAAMKSAQIEKWRAERIGGGGVLAASPVMRTARRILAGDPVTQADRADSMALFHALDLQFQYSGAALLDRQGVVRIGSGAYQVDSPRLQAAREAQRTGKVTLSDLYRDPPESGPLCMAVSVPVADLGAIVLDVDPSRFLYPYLAAWPTASRTGETLLFRRDGDDLVSLNDLRHSPGSALNPRQRVAMPSLPDDRLPGAAWLHKGPDYRGVPSIGVIHGIQGSAWYLAAKLDLAEVYAPLIPLSWVLALMVALIAVSSAAGVGYIWRSGQLRAHRQLCNFPGPFDSLTRYANDIIVLVDDSGRIVQVNQRAVEAYGYSEWELLSLDIASFRAEVPGQPPMWRAADIGDGIRYEAVHRRKDGSTFPADISLRLIELGSARYRQAIVRDISERVRTENEIKALSARLLNAQDEERKRIARELHDDISQQIAALSIGMSNLRKQIPVEQTEAREQSQRIQQNMAHVSESIRRLSHELHPAVLEYSGLAAALRDCCSEFGLMTHIQISYKTRGSFGDVPPDAALCVYRVAQEALQNVAKHAHVSQADVDLTRAEGEICLTVSDRGTGMALDGAGAPAGLGLVSIKERTRLVNGAVQIRSEPNQGTTLTLTIPVGAASAGANAFHFQQVAIERSVGT
jgi:PAS domain S-box-containing protein